MFNQNRQQNYKPYTLKEVKEYANNIECEKKAMRLAIENLFRNEANQIFQNHTNPIWLIDNEKLEELEKLNNWLQSNDDDFFRSVPQCIINWNNQLPDREIFIQFLELNGKSHLVEKIPHYTSGYRAQ